MNFSVSTLLVGAVLVFIQVLAALPWLALVFLNPDQRSSFRLYLRKREFWLYVLGGWIAVFVVPALVQVFVQERGVLEACGQLYAAVLQMQLLADLFIFGFALLLRLWPKGGAVALSAFREGVRQPMFWLLALIAWGLMTVSPLIPYFTFGEDYLMVKQLGYDVIMLFAALFGTLAASLFISEEIEGRTAVTLMSKPVSRRQFLIGKFVGIVAAAGVLFALVGTYFEGVLLFAHWWEKLGPIGQQMVESASVQKAHIGVVPPPPWLTDTLNAWALPSMATHFLRGAGIWTAHTLDTLPGLILAFSQVMVLVSIAVALATRVPMVVNLTTVVVVYFLAHLTPVLIGVGRKAQIESPGSAVSQMLAFMAQFFDTLLPDLGAFRLDPTLLTDAPPPPFPFAQYLGSVTLYGVLYTSLVLLLGLILFEDRDLA